MRPGSRSSRARTTTTSWARTARTSSSTACSRSPCSSGSRRRCSASTAGRRPGSSSAPSCSRSAGRPGPRRRRRSTRTTSPPSSTTGCRSRSDWVDEATGGKPAVYIGQKIADPNGIWSMEFWNRNVRRVWSLDGTAPGPGPVLTPDLIATDGRLAGDPGYELRRDRQRPRDRRQRPLPQQGVPRSCGSRSRCGSQNRSRASSATAGSGARSPAGSVIADYNQFDAPKKPGDGLVTLSRKGFCGPHAPGTS